ncbi:MAG: endo-1,4-beta-xylanase, partial [Prolixibacteraceae bacterium]
MKRIFVTALFFISLSWNHIVISQIRENLNDSIQKYRTGIIVVKTTPGTKVELEQLNHEFWFGCSLPNNIFNGNAGNEDIQKFKDMFLKNFNSAVTENALKWGQMEPRKGEVRFTLVENMLTWCEENNIPLRGHNIYWGTKRFVQDWLKEMNDEQLTQELEKRGRMIGARYKGRFAEYDFNNEMLLGDYYQERLGPQITAKMAGWVKEGDPEAKLFLNDFGILTGQRLHDFAEHVKDLQNRGVPIDGIGVQGHAHGEDFNRDSLQNALDALAQFDLPVRITELYIPGGRSKFRKDRTLKPTPEEEKQFAQSMEDYYRICFAHPAVDAVILWGYWEGAMWMPASALYRDDWSLTPSGEVYRSLVFDKWWTRSEGKSDENGFCTIPAYFGTHRVTVNGKSKTVELRKADRTTFID